MGSDSATDYPAEAYSPDGTLWWKLTNKPGKRSRLGDEIKLAAWLASSLDVGDTFTMRDLREALGQAAPNDAEHLNRRLRELRSRDGWVIPSNKDDGNLPVGTYRVDVKGWHPGTGTERAPKNAVSQSLQRRVFERDGKRCVVCGVGSREPYPGGSGKTAVLTVGHIIANEHGGSSKDINNLRTECARCNETVRQEIRVPETLQEVLPDVRNLSKQQKARLLSWVHAGYRTRDQLDMVYDRVRYLAPDEMTELRSRLQAMAGVPAS